MLKALSYSLASKNIGMIISLATSIVLARLISPEEIGIYTIASICISYAQFIRDFGIPDYLIKEKNITQQKVSSAFTLMLIISISLVFILALSSPAIANFYEVKDIENIIYILSLNFLIIPFGSSMLTLFRRQMNFKPIFIANIVSISSNAAIAIPMAFAGYSFYALAVAALFSNLIQTVVLYFFKTNQYSFSISFRNIKDIISFGGSMSIANILIFVGESIIEILAGKFIGMAEVGLYSKAKATIYLFSQTILQAVRPVASPYFAQIERQKGDVLYHYTQITKYVLYLALPFSFMIIFCSEEIILLLFGKNWINAAPLMSILGIEMFFYSFSFFAGTLVTSLGLSNVYLRLQGGIAILKIAAAVILVSNGIDAIIFGYIFIAASSVLATFIVLRRHISFKFSDLSRMVSRPLLATSLFSTIYFSFLHFLDDFSFPGIISGVTSGLFYLVILYFMERDSIRKLHASIKV
ncbi:MAG: lipopolysaccharide biosynthesis protein [Motiliproteus sp.]|nr:lipopolysaccharide biosynthesis protein [Motiliproteus sp.]MCW9052384.1 lipopolysaccharide biosynthesis protein [Motiliproteus sp.]